MSLNTNNILRRTIQMEALADQLKSMAQSLRKDLAPFPGSAPSGGRKLSEEQRAKAISKRRKSLTPKTEGHA